MKIISKETFFTLLSLFVFALSSFSAIIYIDPNTTVSYQNGTINNPYSSWTKFSITSGNTYLQKSGTTYTTSRDIALTGKYNVTLGTYGTGAKAKIVTTGTGNGILYITNSYNLVIKDLEITSTGTWTAGIIIQGSSSGNNLINNCHIHKAGWGIRLLTSAGGNKIMRSTIHDILDDGIFVQDASSIEIGHCKIYDINKKFLVNRSESYSAGDGIQMSSTNNLYFNIHNNIIDHSSMGNKLCIIAAGGNYSGIIEKNTIIGSITKGTNGIHLGQTSKTVIVRYNIIKNSSNGIVNYAKILDAYYNRFSTNHVGILVNSGYYSLNARNNVFYNNSKYGIQGSYNTSITLKNNIFNMNSTSTKAIYAVGTISSNNNVFNQQYPGFINGYTSLSTWRNTGNDRNSVVGNPAFVNPSNDDFRLQATSVAINKGANVSLSTDFYGGSVPQASYPDAGLHEYNLTKTSTASLAEVVETTSLDSTLVVKSDTGMKEEANPSIYPNPSEGNYTLSFGKGYDQADIEVYDFAGKLVSSITVNNSSEEKLNLSTLPDGTYIIRLKSSNTTKTLKAVKK